jgi:hypothetical protein
MPHLHFNLVPHRAGDPLTGGPGMLVPGTLDRPIGQHAEAVKAIRTNVRLSR